MYQIVKVTNIYDLQTKDINHKVLEGSGLTGWVPETLSFHAEVDGMCVIRFLLLNRMLWTCAAFSQFSESLTVFHEFWCNRSIFTSSLKRNQNFHQKSHRNLGKVPKLKGLLDPVLYG